MGILEPEDMVHLKLIHKNPLKHLEDKCLNRPDVYLLDGGVEYLVSTQGAKIIESNLWEQKPDRFNDMHHCFKYKIKLELTDEAVANPKIINYG